MDKVRIGVFGADRGFSMINYCEQAGNAKIVAICDKYVPLLDHVKQKLNDPDITYYTTFDEFIKHDMDAVVMANYANEHAPFAMRCMRAGMHVFSEVLPIQAMSEAVQLIECIQETGKIYAYGENYCYMPAPREMRRLYRSGAMGKFEYAEGEYLHNCESIWPQITYGDPNHWRNNMYANFYCTHSIGPIVHITGLRPVSVTGFEMPFNARHARMGAKAGHTALEMITFENGAMMKSIHGTGCSTCSIWFDLQCENGGVESGREAAGDGVQTIYVDVEGMTDAEGNRKHHYQPKDEHAEEAKSFGHGNSDFYTMYNFCEKILGREAEVIDVFEALDMFLPGLLAYRSVLNGNIPMEIPNFRDPEVRERYRHDNFCTDPKVAGDQWVPSYSKGNPDIPDSVYQTMREEYEKKGFR